MGVGTVRLVYFSGTGGTAKVADCLTRAFRDRGAAVRVTELNANASAGDPADLLVVAFPVYAANAPEPVEAWIDSAPPGNGAAAAVLSVSGGGEVSPNTACRVRVIRRLEQRGYRVAYERMLVMPANFLLPYDDILSAMLLRAAPIRAGRIAEDLLAGRVRRVRPKPADRLVSWMCGVEKVGARFFGRKLKAGERCTGCGWCAEHCPRGNITLRNGRPAFGNACVLCLRCVYGCPHRAITPGIGGFAVLSQGFDLKALEARTQDLAELPSAAEAAKGRWLQGVRSYLEEEE